MATVTEQAVWVDSIYQIAEDDPVQGGENGIDNIPHQQLANRTAYLKKRMDDLVLPADNSQALADVQQGLTNEIKARQDSEQAIYQRLDGLGGSGATIDNSELVTQLQQDLSAETQARIQGDNDLNRLITTNNKRQLCGFFTLQYYSGEFAGRTVENATCGNAVGIDSPVVIDVTFGDTPPSPVTGAVNRCITRATILMPPEVTSINQFFAAGDVIGNGADKPKGTVVKAADSPLSLVFDSYDSVTRELVVSGYITTRVISIHLV